MSWGMQQFMFFENIWFAPSELHSSHCWNHMVHMWNFVAHFLKIAWRASVRKTPRTQDNIHRLFSQWNHVPFSVLWTSLTSWPFSFYSVSCLIFVRVGSYRIEWEKLGRLQSNGQPWLYKWLPAMEIWRKGIWVVFTWRLKYQSLQWIRPPSNSTPISMEEEPVQDISSLATWDGLGLSPKSCCVD